MWVESAMESGSGGFPTGEAPCQGKLRYIIEI